MARRPFLFKMLGAVGAVFGLAVLFPFASLGPRPGVDLYQTKWRKGSRATTVDGVPVRPGDIAVNGILTVFPEGDINDALSPTLLINLGDAPFEIPPARVGWNIGGLVAFSKICTHAGCPASPVQRADPPAHLPLPPIHLRRAGRLQAGVRTGASLPAPAADNGRQPRATWCPRATTPSPSVPGSGTGDEHHRGAGRRPEALRRRASRCSTPSTSGSAPRSS